MEVLCVGGVDILVNTQDLQELFEARLPLITIYLAIENGLIHLDENRAIDKKRTKDEYTDQAAYMSLNKNLIEPLQKYWRFISETKVGTHHIITLTEEGKHALHFLSADV